MTEPGLAPRLDLAIIRRLIQEIGVFGQAFFPSRRVLCLTWALTLACPLVLAACAGDPAERLQSGKVLPWAGPEGRWVGPVAPIEPGCGLQATGLMSIGTSTFAFDPFQSTAVLQGKISPTEELDGAALRPVAGGKFITLRFLGRIQHLQSAEKIVGTLTSGRCQWSVTLLRA